MTYDQLSWSVIVYVNRAFLSMNFDNFYFLSFTFQSQNEYLIFLFMNFIIICGQTIK